MKRKVVSGNDKEYPDKELFNSISYHGSETVPLAPVFGGLCVEVPDFSNIRSLRRHL